MKTSVTTIAEVTDCDYSWDIYQALQKAFKDEAYVSDELREDDLEGYSFTFKEGVPFYMDKFVSKVAKVIAAASAKEKKEDSENEARAKKNLEGFSGSELTPVKNLFAMMMDPVILSFNKRILNYMAENEFVMAESAWNDQQDLITLRHLLDTKPYNEAYKFARNLDSMIRECIPNLVYRYMMNEEE